MPHYKPLGATSNPIHRVADATKTHASAPDLTRNCRTPMNDPG